MQNIVQSMINDSFPLIKLLKNEYTNNLTKNIESIIENNMQKSSDLNRKIPKIKLINGKLFLPNDIFEKIGYVYKYFVEMVYYYVSNRSILLNLDGVCISYNNEPILFLKNTNTINQNEYLLFDLIHFDKILNDLINYNSYKNFVIQNQHLLIKVKDVSSFIAFTAFITGLSVFGLCKYNLL